MSLRHVNYNNVAGILTSVDSVKPVQPPYKLRNWKWCSVTTLIEYSSDKQMLLLWSDYAYAQASLNLYWSHITCWKSHVVAQMFLTDASGTGASLVFTVFHKVISV